MSLFLGTLADKPVISTAPLLSKSAADLGETARIVCEASGVPAVNFTWSRAGGPPVSASTQYETFGGEWRSKYQISQRVIDPLKSSAELLIFNVTNDDYGDFECIAHNSEGEFCPVICFVDPRLPWATAAFLRFAPGGVLAELWRAGGRIRGGGSATAVAAK